MQTHKNVPRSSDQVDVDVVSENSETNKTLDHFFSRMFPYRTRFLSNVHDARNAILGKHTSRLWILRVAHLDDPTLDLIATASCLKEKPFIIALTLDPKSELTTSLFASGVDDVWRLPINLEELAYRLRSRSRSIGLEFDFTANQMQDFDIVADIALRADLTDIEARVFRVLLENEGRAVSRAELSQSIDKTTWDYGDRKFDVHVSRIRKKISKACSCNAKLKTVRSVGYQLKLQNYDMTGYEQQI